MNMSQEMRDALREAKRIYLFEGKNPDVTGVGIGIKRKGGKYDTAAGPVLVVKVKKKRAAHDVNERRLIPAQFAGVQTDVQEGEFTSLADDVGDVEAEVVSQELTRKRRPCKPGYSIGHVRVSAGTLGAYVLVNGEDDYRILSNNHVIADSNGGALGDWILQQAAADGGSSPGNYFARLEKYVLINFDGGGGGGKSSKRLARAYWKSGRWTLNAFAKLFGCEYELPPAERRAGSGVSQPTPNLVDAGLAKPTSQENVKHEYAVLEVVAQGFRDLGLGESVRKVGRTTEFTEGTVTATELALRVSYREQGSALFDDQLEITAGDGDFSAGGDSGSAILTADNYIGGLLFAGGGGVTIANKISHVQRLLGIRL